MIEEIEIEIPAKKAKQFRKLVCDVCGKSTTNYDNWGGSDEKISINITKSHTSNMYDGGGDVEETSFDLCEECFDNKLVPFLESLGATKRIHEWDY